MSANLPSDADARAGTRDWPHAPPHRLAGAGVYFVTARMVDGVRHFHSPARLTRAQDSILGLAAKYGWRPEAWAVLANHYHLVAHSPAEEDSARSLRGFLRHRHADLSRYLNNLDRAEGRKIWHNYRETHLTFQRSYLARLNYTHSNPVHHGLVRIAADYQWCSARAFERTCSPAWAKTIASFRYTEIAVEDGDV